MKHLPKAPLLLLLLLSSFSLFGRIEDQDIEHMDQGLVIERISSGDIEVTMPNWVFSFSEAEVQLKFKNPEHTKLLISNNTLDFIVNGENQNLTFDKGVATFKLKPVKGQPLSIYCEEFHYEGQINVIGSWVIIAPAVLILLMILRKLMRKRKMAS